MGLAKIKIELREISLKNRPKELYDASSKGTVPVLILGDDTVIDESLDIMQWATKEGGLNWGRDDKENQLQAIENNDQKFKKWLDKYKYHDRYPENNMEFYRKECDKYLSAYEKILANQKYLFSTQNLTLGDAALFPFIRQFNGVDPDYMHNYPELNKWLNNIINSELFISIMGKYEFWVPGSKGTAITFL